MIQIEDRLVRTGALTLRARAATCLCSLRQKWSECADLSMFGIRRPRYCRRSVSEGLSPKMRR